MKHGFQYLQYPVCNVSLVSSPPPPSPLYHTSGLGVGEWVVHVSERYVLSPRRYLSARVLSYVCEAQAAGGGNNSKRVFLSQMLDMIWGRFVAFSFLFILID